MAKSKNSRAQTLERVPISFPFRADRRALLVVYAPNGQFWDGKDSVVGEELARKRIAEAVETGVLVLPSERDSRGDRLFESQIICL